MTRILPASILLLATWPWPLATAADTPANRSQSGPLPIEVHFSPKGGCTDAIVKEAAAAKSTVLVQAYWFNSRPIAKALVEAHKRGVKVEVILDLSRTEIDSSQADVLFDNHVPTFTDGQHLTAHSKIIIIDGQAVVTGSFNFSGQSETQNAENLLVIRDKGIADQYTANWKAHREHSKPYVKP
jgi:phosphatidylserine/phosphatidylglycerophosphate/cardiolipin synthase-like enzyme